MRRCIQYYKNVIPSNAGRLKAQFGHFILGDIYHIEFEKCDDTKDLFVVCNFADSINPEWLKDIEEGTEVISVPMKEPESLAHHMLSLLPLQTMSFIPNEDRY